MGNKEFKRYMDKQITEIEKYKKNQSRNNLHFNSNECVFEWIRNNAEGFSQKWENYSNFKN